MVRAFILHRCSSVLSLDLWLWVSSLQKALEVSKEKLEAGTNRKNAKHLESVCKGKDFFFFNQVSDLE